MNIPLSPCVPENLASRDGFSRPVPRQPAHLHTQAESGAYLRDCPRVPRRRPFMKPPYAIGPVPSLSGHAIAYRWRLLPRVRRHRASKPQGSSERVLPWQITMDQLVCPSLSHTHYWYEVSMLKVPATVRFMLYTYINHHAQPPIIPQHNHSKFRFFFKYIVTSIVLLLSIIVLSRHTGIGVWVNSKLYTINSILYNLIVMQGYCTNNTEYTGSLGYNSVSGGC